MANNYPPHALFVFGGDVPSVSGPTEIWACGIRCCALVGGNPGFIADEDACLNQLVPKLKSWFTAAANSIAGSAGLTFAKLNNIDALGHYQDPVTHQQTWTRITGPSTPTVPSFLSLAYTWETGLTRGRAHRGRIYPPNYTYAMSGPGVSTVGGAVTAAKNLLAIFTGTTDGTNLVLPYVVSHFGPLHAITGVSIDNAWDVQRRRKNRLQNTRTTASWP